MGICCLDYKHPYLNIDFNTITIKEALQSDIINKFEKELLENQRTIPICRKCGWAR